MAIIKLRRGDSLSLRISFFVDENPYPMTGWTIEGSISYLNCNPVSLTFEWIDQDLGVGRLILETEETMNLEAGDHDLQIRRISSLGVATSTTPVTIRVRD